MSDIFHTLACASTIRNSVTGPLVSNLGSSAVFSIIVQKFPIVQKALEISSRQCGSIQFKKMENLRLRYEFVGNYYLFKSEQYLTFVKQHLKSLNYFA